MAKAKKKTKEAVGIYTIDGEKGTPEVGKIYLVEHSRKGTFRIRVTSVDGEWATGEIVEGHASAANPDNERSTGESLTMRASLCKLATGKKLPANEWDGKPIPMEKWGRDHVSTLFYVESVCTDNRGVPDARRMRTEPGRVKRGRYRDHESGLGIVHGRYATRLKDGFELFGHDDWDCVSDMVEAGLVEWFGTSLDPIFKLTDLGYAVAANLRKQKAEGRTVAEYEFAAA